LKSRTAQYVLVVSFAITLLGIPGAAQLPQLPQPKYGVAAPQWKHWSWSLRESADAGRLGALLVSRGFEPANLCLRDLGASQGRLAPHEEEPNQIYRGGPTNE